MPVARDERSDQLFIPGYEILRLIGCGGMGEVYLARQLSLGGRLVAVKILALATRVDPVEQAVRFRREAELMARVRHPNIVTVHDFGTVEDRPYLVMEYIEGGDLRRQMEPGRPFPLVRVRPLIAPVTRALEHLHAHGILHRDLKPENILMDRETTPMLSDFGLAVLDSDVGVLTRSDGALGTIGYVAPEQQYRLGIDERADQYSMAALMYELLTGQRPLGVFKPPSQLNPVLGPGIDDVLLRALQEDPDDRYPSIKDFGEALEQNLDSPTVRPLLDPGPRPLPWYRLRARPMLVTLVIAVVVLVLVASSAEREVRKNRASIRKNALPIPRLPAPEAVPEATPARLVNSLGMTMVLIPAGEFLMGAPDSDRDARDDERPIHPVRISRPFYLGATEVTVGRFRAFVEATGYETEAETSGEGGTIYSAEKRKFVTSPGINWRNPGLPLPQSDDEPVVQVSWNDAMAFCRWLSEREGRACRLPTEAEWEYACRAGSTTRWCMGDDPAELIRFAWSRDRPGATTHLVGRKEPNAFGLHDMHGNVWEWCLDWFELYKDAPAVDPNNATSVSGQSRVLRGGSFSGSDINRTRSSSRTSRPPSHCYYRFGFRVCFPIEEKAEER